jgi:hypothetical protein
VKVIATIRKNSGVTYHRIEKPLQKLKDQGHDIHIIENAEDLTEELFEGATHFIASRFFPVKNINAFKDEMKRKGIKTILDNDDHWEIPKDNPAHEKYEAGIKHMVKASMLFADEVWVTHNRLADLTKSINQNVFIVPNAIDSTDPMWKDHEAPGEQLKFGYVGGASHLLDLEYSKLDLSNQESTVVNIKGFQETIKAKETMNPLKVHEYGNLYRNFDVSLIPLRPDPFSEMKSNLKMLEAGFSNKAVIVQNVHPYSPLIRPNRNCIAVGKGQDWNKAVKNLDPNQAYDLAMQLNEDVQKFELQKVNNYRINLLS